jgi:hypothetical protein
MTIESQNTSVGGRRWIILVGAAVVVLIGLGSTLLGLGEGRQSLGGGVLADFWQIAHAVLGVVLSFLAGVVAVAVSRRSRRVATIIVAGIVVAWLSWLGGNALAIAQGPGTSYKGTVQISLGSQVMGAVSVTCTSVVGDDMQVAEVDVSDPNGFDLIVRHRINRTPEPRISGVEAVGGSSLTFGQVESIVADGLVGHATVSAVVVGSARGAGSPAEVTIDWTCNPASRGPIT